MIRRLGQNRLLNIAVNDAIEQITGQARPTIRLHRDHMPSDSSSVLAEYVNVNMDEAIIFLAGTQRRTLHFVGDLPLGFHVTVINNIVNALPKVLMSGQPTAADDVTFTGRRHVMKRYNDGQINDEFPLVLRVNSVAEVFVVRLPTTTNASGLVVVSGNTEQA